jgi:hypothetical protein
MLILFNTVYRTDCDYSTGATRARAQRQGEQERVLVVSFSCEILTLATASSTVATINASKPATFGVFAE